MNHNSSVVLDTPAGIDYFHLAQLKAAVKLESVGMRHSSGKSARKRACILLAIPQRTAHAEVVQAIQARMETMLLEARHGSRHNPNP